MHETRGEKDLIEPAMPPPPGLTHIHEVGAADSDGCSATNHTTSANDVVESANKKRKVAHRQVGTCLILCLFCSFSGFFQYYFILNLSTGLFYVHSVCDQTASLSILVDCVHGVCPQLVIHG